LPANSGALTGTIAHKHSALSADGGFLDDAVTGVTGTANGSLLMFDGSSVAQDLPSGNLNDVLTMGAAVPSWQATSSSAVWEKIADVENVGAGQLEATFATHTLLDMWIIGANSVSINTALNFNDDVLAHYRSAQFVDGVYSMYADDEYVTILGSNDNDDMCWLNVKTFYDSTTTDTSYFWEGVQNGSGSGADPVCLTGWGYYYGSQITEVCKSQFGNILNSQKAGARLVVFGAL